ncbi:uncharacterized protein BYT42DRAFT_546374 [Radiomyces spectabilis]|uniref:uncharacterized protein n=1 Tax=Radiomyces spectabilis TaxID=64574 RepID=UPI00221E5733|nr:uncharacterized protein BYT42DRAFT_546374 [Radiomyces spectabilis]KAI8377731.1 hypothetical protein BYT42DRAFT_546374 [Radiomyces spectabilis]
MCPKDVVKAAQPDQTIDTTKDIDLQELQAVYCVIGDQQVEILENAFDFALDLRKVRAGRPIENLSHEIRQFSNAEYYTKAGYKSFTKILQERKVAADITEIDSRICSSKVTNIPEAIAYIQSILANLHRLTEFYGINFGKWRFKRYVNEQKINSELVIFPVAKNTDSWRNTKKNPHQHQRTPEDDRRTTNNSTLDEARWKNVVHPLNWCQMLVKKYFG